MNSLLSWAAGGSRSVGEEVEEETASGDEFSGSASRRDRDDPRPGSSDDDDDHHDDEHDEPAVLASRRVVMESADEIVVDGFEEQEAEAALSEESANEETEISKDTDSAVPVAAAANAALEAEELVTSNTRCSREDSLLQTGDSTNDDTTRVVNESLLAKNAGENTGDEDNAERQDAKPDTTAEGVDEETKEIETEKISADAKLMDLLLGDGDGSNAGEVDDEPEDLFPRARDFLADLNDDITLMDAAATIVSGFNNDESGAMVNIDDSRTISSHKTSGTRVQPISAAFRSAMELKEESELRNKRHPHQSIFDILDRNFKDLGDSGNSLRGLQISYKEVKLCFVAFVTVFSLPSEPVFAQETLNEPSAGENGSDDESIHSASYESGATAHADEKEGARLSVPVSVAFALWSKILHLPTHSKGENQGPLSYIRSTLVLLGVLDLASIDKDRDDVSAPSIPGRPDKKTIDCLIIHDSIHKQYGEYLAFGDHDASFQSVVNKNSRPWNEAVSRAARSLGFNEFTLKMLPTNTMRSARFQDTFDLLNDMTFVRKRTRVLGPIGTCKAHVGDMDELLSLIEKQTCRSNNTILEEELDERQGLMGAYEQVLKYCMHEVDDLTKKSTAGVDEEAVLSKSEGLRVTDVGIALHLLGASLGGYGFFDLEMRYYEDALRLKKLAPGGSRSLSASDTLHSMGFSLDNAGKTGRSLECYDQALEIRLECLGEDDLRVAETLHNKGALLCEEDRANESMECLEEALRIREWHHGEEHETCADTMQWMGNLLRKHGDPNEALEYFKFALSIKQKRLGSDDIDVANTLFNTAVLLDDIGKYELSLVAYKEALRIRQLVLGKMSQEVADTLFCIGNVATVLEKETDALGNYTDAIDILESLIRDATGSQQKNIDDTMLFISNPKSCSVELSTNYEKLTQCLEEALPLTKLVMGSDHPSVYDLLVRMGDSYMKLNDYDNAIGSLMGALRARRGDNPGSGDDEEVACLLQKKGIAHLYKKEVARAKKTFDEALQIRRRIPSTSSIQQTSSTYCLGASYYYSNDYSHALLLFQECLKVYIKESGEDSPIVAQTLYWTGKQYAKLGKPGKALEFLLSALRILKKDKAATDYFVVVSLLHSIGLVYEQDAVSSPEMALKCYAEAIGLIHSKLQPENRQCAKSLIAAHEASGMLCKKQKETDQAIEHLEKAHGLLESSDDKSRLASVSDTLGMLYESKGQEDLASAKKHYSNAYSLYEKHVGRDKLATSDCAFRLAGVLKLLQSSLALDFYKESLRVRRLNVHQDDERAGEILYFVGTILIKDKSFKLAVDALEESLAIGKSLLGDCRQVADTYHQLGKAYHEMDQSEKALILYKECVRINKAEGATDSLYRASLSLAKCAASCSQFQLAIDSYNNCLVAMQADESALDDKSALVLEKMGDINLLHLKKFEDAAKSFIDAMEIRRRHETEESFEDDVYANQILHLVLQAAKSFTLSNDNESALMYYNEHIDLLDKYFPDEEDLLADSLLELGNVLSAKASDDEAIEKLSDCLDIKLNLHGHDSADVSDVRYSLAKCHAKCGQNDRAAQLFGEALRCYEAEGNYQGVCNVYVAIGQMKSSDMNSPDRSAALESYESALKARRQIAIAHDGESALLLYEYSTLLCQEGNFDAASTHIEEALKIQKRLSGLKDPLVAKILLTKARINAKQVPPKHEIALVCLEQVLFIQGSFQEDCTSLDVGLCHSLMGDVYLGQGENKKAIDSFNESIKIYLSIDSEDSVVCAAVYNDLGMAYGRAKEFDKAIESLIQALRIRKMKLGNESLEYGQSVYSLALIHVDMEKFNQALNCLNEAVRVFEQYDDEESDQLIQAIELKGDCSFEVGDFAASAASFQGCIEALIPADDDSGKSYDRERVARLNCKLGHSYSKIDEYEQAFDSYSQSVKDYVKSSGADDLKVADVMYDIVILLVEQDKDALVSKALVCFGEVVRIYKEKGRRIHAKVADSLVQKSKILIEQSDHDEASPLLEDALEVYRELLGNDSTEVGQVMMLRGKLHDECDNQDDAYRDFKEALRIFQKCLGEDDVHVSLALFNLGTIDARKKEHAKAIEQCKEALKIRVKRGDQDRDVADSAFNIATIYDDWGDSDQAFQYYSQCLKFYRELAGDMDTSVGNCYYKLGSIHWARGDVELSMSNFLDALRIFEQEDDTDGDVLITLFGGLARCYFRKEQFSVAMEWFLKHIRVLKIHRGEDCLEMAEPCFSVGLIYEKMDKFEEALNFMSKALMLFEKFHGKGSKDCQGCELQIAKVLLALEKYDESLAKFKCYLSQYHKDQSEETADVADAFHRMGQALQGLDKCDEARMFLKKALRASMKIHGNSSLQVAQVLVDLGNIMAKSGSSDEAIAVYDQSIAIFQKHPEDHDVDILASTYVSLAVLLDEKDDFEASLHSWKNALKLYSELVGSGSDEVAEILFKIGILYNHLQNYDRATSCFSESVRIVRNNGDDDEMVANALCHIAKNYARKRQFARGLEMSMEALRLKKQFCSAPEIASCLVDCGDILDGWGKPDQALRFLDEALRIYREQEDESHVTDVANCKRTLGCVYRQLGDSKTALDLLVGALAQHRAQGDDTLEVAGDLFEIGQVYDSFGDREKGLKCFEECLKIREEKLGSDHLDVMAAHKSIRKLQRHKDNSL